MESALALILAYRYLVLLPLAIIEGPVVALIAGYLAHVGVLDFWLAYGVLCLGDLGPDSVFYAIGHYGGKIPALRNRIMRSKVLNGHYGAIEKLWTYHGRKTMLFGKLAYGMGLPFLASAGLVGMPFGRFLRYAFPVTVLQYGVIMAIGYYIGQTSAVATYLKSFYVVVGLLVGLAIVGYIVMARYARKKVLEMEREEEAGTLDDN